MSLVYLLANAIPIIIVCSQQEKTIYIIMTLFVFFYTLIMSLATFIYYKRIHEMIRLRFLNDELVEELNQKNNELKENQKHMIHSSRLAAVGEMAGGVAHEINNPLTVIINYARKLRKVIVSDSKVENYVTKIEVNSNRISTIIDSLKSLVLKKIVLRKKQVCLKQL